MLCNLYKNGSLYYTLEIKMLCYMFDITIAVYAMKLPSKSKSVVCSYLLNDCLCCRFHIKAAIYVLQLAVRYMANIKMAVYVIQLLSKCLCLTGQLLSNFPP